MIRKLLTVLGLSLMAAASALIFITQPASANPCGQVSSCTPPPAAQPQPAPHCQGIRPCQPLENAPQQCYKGWHNRLYCTPG